MSAELAACRTAAAAVLADYQREAVTADVADRAMWAARLADMLGYLLAELERLSSRTDSSKAIDDVRAAYPEWTFTLSGDGWWRACLTTSGDRQPELTARTLAGLAQQINDLIAGEPR